MGRPLALPALAPAAEPDLDAAAVLALAFGDWAMHLAASPGKLVELQRKAARKWLRYLTGTPIEPLP
jgi:Poly-beta-hydroxybutyrate polymerase N terminal